MDSNGYETFEYLQPDNVDDSNQFFVLQNDGTILSINRPVEFVTQVQNEHVLEEVQPAYDVAPQQFYVDVNNSSDLITVPDEFIIPTEENSIYSNNFLLQQPSNSSDVQIQQNVSQIPDNVVEQLILPDINVPMDVNINDNNIETENLQNNGCTEIAITDEQYKILEQKGWILLETNDKAYLLDPLGLHDITSDTSLIQKLRAELASGDTNYTEAFASNETKMLLNEDIANIVNVEQVAVPYVPESGEQINLEAIPAYPSIDEDPENLQVGETKEVPDLMPLEKEFLETTINELSEKYEKSDPRINSNTIKIKTKFSLNEIPEEIVLGKTVNGKKLVARIAKPKEPEVLPEPTDSNDMSLKRKPKTYPTISAFHQKIEKLIHQAVRGHARLLSEAEVFANVDKVIQQLLRVPAFKPAVIERKLIITKVTIMENEDQNSCKKSAPLIMTGQVIKQDENKWCFQYIPDMLQKIREIEEDEKPDKKRQEGGDVDATFLQVHIQEVKSPDGIARISITLNKRVISLKAKKVIENALQEKQTPKPKTVYACTACAAVFKWKYNLQRHQQTHKMDFDFDSLITINSKNSENPFDVIEEGYKKEFICNECDYKNSRVSMMLRHIRSHFTAMECDEDSNGSDTSSQRKYKCKMCSIIFLHPSTLSKHILSKHIKVS